MLNALLAHQGVPNGIHRVWSDWNVDPVVLLGLAAAAWVYHQGTRRRGRIGRPGRERCFWLGLAAVAVALLTPLDRLSAELASAHMVQHVLLVLVAAPLLAYSAPMATMLGGTPPFVRTGTGRVRRVLRGSRPLADALRAPTVAWLLHAATLWLWHTSVAYDAALAHPVLHALEHASFLGTGVLFWTVLRPVRATAATSRGHGALLVFAMAMQSVFLAALLTFAGTPWYDGYSTTTRAWGLEPLADQHLAGVIMWVPAGLLYTGFGVLLVVAWVRDSTGGAHDGPLEDDWAVKASPPPAPLRTR